MNKRIPPKGYCYIEGEIRRRTDMAVLFFDGSREAWIPSSCIEDEEELDNGMVEVLVEQWVAEDKGLV